MPVTSGDRVLIHLFHRGEPEGWSGGVSDQDMIASSCGIGRTHVPRTLKPLINGGMITEDLGRAPGRPRRVKVYSLTENGTLAAREAIDRCEKEELDWIDDEGLTHHGSVRDVHIEINHLLVSLSMGSIPLPQFLSILKETVPWNDIMWTSASIGHCGSGPLLPNGWKPYVHKDPIKGQTFDNEELVLIDGLLEKDGMAILKGPSGSGKMEMIDLWSRSRGRRGLVLEKGDSGGNCLEGGPWDLLVLLGGGDPDVDRLLHDDNEVKDIRDQDWPSELNGIDLIMTTSADIALKGPVIEIKGMAWDLFRERATSAGLDELLSQELFRSTKGSPVALRSIIGSSDEYIQDLNDMDTEEAVLKVLLSLKKK